MHTPHKRSTTSSPWLLVALIGLVVTIAAGQERGARQAVTEAKAETGDEAKAVEPTASADAASAAAKPEGDAAAKTDAAKTPESAAGAEGTDAAAASAEGDGAEAGEAKEPEEPAPEEMAIAFKDMQLEKLAKFFSEKLGKPVIPHESVKGKKITIISAEKRPLAEGLRLIADALRQIGVIIQEYPNRIEFLPIDQLPRLARPVIGPDELVADVEDKSQIVDKIFAVEHYDVSKLNTVIVGMLPDFGFVLADANANRLIVTSTVSNLERIEAVVMQLDVPQASQTLTRTFVIKHADAAEIVSILKILIAGKMGRGALDVTGSRGGSRDRGRPSRGGSDESGSATLLIEASKAPILIRTEVSRNWIIVVAPASMMKQIAEWIEERDVPRDADEPFEWIQVYHGELNQIVEQLRLAVEAIPDNEVRQSVRIVPFTRTRKLLVYGSQRGRGIVKSLMAELDVDVSEYKQVKEFELKHTTAEKVEEKINDLFGDGSSNTGGYYSYYYYRYRSSRTEEAVKITTDSQRNTITVITDADKMKQIEELILTKWDQPLNIEDIQPKIYTLIYTDALQVQEILESMFTESTTSSRYWWDPVETTTPVGPLFGQFSFQAIEESNRLIVTTKSRANYKVIDDMLAEIDQPQEAGLPEVVPLRHANAEDLAEQLNALLSLEGTTAEILRSRRGLTVVPVTSGSGSSGSSGSGGAEEEARGDAMTFWWSKAGRDDTQRSISNLIGKPRFVPVNRMNGIMVLAPRGYLEPIMELIEELDQPGRQVVIHAIVAEIQHTDEMTLGLRIASDPSILSDARLIDQSIAGRVDVDIVEDFGVGVLSAGVDMNVLINLLMKKLNLKILLEPKIYTADNQEAVFFDGQDVPTATSRQTSQEGTAITQSVRQNPVGTRLQVRPHITQDGEVDLRVNLEISRIASGQTLFGNFIFDRRETTTHVIVNNGQTVMISGIVRQEDFDEVRKLPGLGDLPLLGPLFRSTDRAVRNRELVVFITPTVIESGGDHEQMRSDQNATWVEHVRDAMGDGRQQWNTDENDSDAETDALIDEQEGNE